MIKTILGLIVKVLESRLKKSGIEEELLKNKNYFIEARKIWSIVDENKRISGTIEGKIINKAEEFGKLILDKFPELSQSDIDNLRQSVAGVVNQGKEAVLSNSDLIKQLSDENLKYKTENAELKNTITKIQSTAIVTGSFDSDSLTINGAAIETKTPGQAQ